jgi:crossover junction endodeoxyribonuclease RuvC
MIIGIDPGLSGGIAIYDPQNGHSAIKMPETALDIALTLKDAQEASGGDVKAFLEHVHAMPGNGASSSWKFAQNFGEIRGILTALEIPFEMVSPMKWMKGFRQMPKDRGDRKKELKRLAQELYPELKATLSTADAILIMEYGRNKTISKEREE